MSAVDDVVICPRCQGENSVDAVFCANPVCHKALGEFSFVTEEIAEHSSWLQRLSDRVAAWVGHPHFVSVHVIWFGLWAWINSGEWGSTVVFDAYPYGLLGIILAVEAVLITSMLLISNNRQNDAEPKRDELEYEVNISSYRLLMKLRHELHELHARIERVEQTGPR